MHTLRVRPFSIKPPLFLGLLFSMLLLLLLRLLLFSLQRFVSYLNSNGSKPSWYRTNTIFVIKIWALSSRFFNFIIFYYIQNGPRDKKTVNRCALLTKVNSFSFFFLYAHLCTHIQCTPKTCHLMKRKRAKNINMRRKEREKTRTRKKRIQ